MKSILRLLSVVALASAALITVGCHPDTTSPSTTASTASSVASTVGKAAASFESNPIVQQGEGFLTGEAIIKYIPEGTPQQRAQIVYSLASAGFTLDNGGPVDLTQGNTIAQSFKVDSEDQDQYDAAATEFLNLAKQQVDAWIASGATKDQIKTGFSNWLVGLQQAGAVNGAIVATASASNLRLRGLWNPKRIEVASGF